MGRSICYRTAVPVPLLAANLMGTEQFSSGRAVRGLDVVWRYFVAHGSLRGGALTQGYFRNGSRPAKSPSPSPKNPVDVVEAEPYSWIRRTQDTFSRRPHRPSNHEIKYESRHYSSATPFPLKDSDLRWRRANPS